ncbi:hypothetical protein niasHT_000798 [Heterodera trifolii]|uniref:Transcription factor AP-2 C-terminal domain-containing protein n=1 Tax=Heterodera trifolii TaxID=157864 RepID=A0ABD2MD96_9BILA
MAPKSLPLELLFEFVPFVRAEDAVPNAFSSCRLFHNLLLPRVDKWKEKIKMHQQEMEALTNENKQQKEEIQKKDEEIERMRKALNEAQRVSAGAGTSSAKSSASFSDKKISVRGRLSLCESAMYDVTLGEIERRVRGLEKITPKDYTSFLRTRKDAGKKHKLVGEIGEEPFGPEIAAAMQNNLKLEKDARVQTCFTPLTEGEALKLANDFRTIIKEHYPSKAIASAIGSVAGQGNGYTMDELFKFRGLLTHILDIHKADPNTLCPSAEKIDECFLPEEIQNGFNAVSELTHGFGQIAIQSVVQTLDEVLQHCPSHSVV